MPFGARTQFVYDWGAITKERLGDLAQPGGQWNSIIGKLINTHDTTSQTCTSLAALFPIQGMLTKVVIPKYCKQGKGKSLLQFLYAIQCIPAVKSPPPDQPDQLAQPGADSPDAPSPPPAVPLASQDPTPTQQSGTAPPTTVQPPQPTLSTKRSRRKESKKSQSKQPTATPTPTPHTHPKPPSTGPKKSTPQSATNPPPTSSAEQNFPHLNRPPPLRRSTKVHGLWQWMLN
ncbi:unnamed protein product [Cylindrotheca closterium]|uniref:Uncharacterized protein n=1 Tax=Cylindrotheca closterium TaxID=2856 RepID=A0AAD2CP56_9STRA|nr:unnamed protein product [Cylindrotheca closterium]